MHTSVLLQETIDGLDLRGGQIVLDCTLGAAGHAKAIVEKIGQSGTLIGIDADQGALDRGMKVFENQKTRVVLKKQNFRHLDLVLAEIGVHHVDRILLDLGLSSNQLEESGRGFTFQKNEPLLMTFEDDPREHLTAYNILNSWEEESLADVIYGFGGERYSRRIARAIVERRLEKPIESTEELAGIVASAVPASYRRGHLHPATKTFQAIRMAVNDELGALKEVLPKAWNALSGEGRLAVISFHEHEDRAVKQFMVEKFKHEGAVRITKKPIVPDAVETRRNPRSRSAKLRIIQKKEQRDS